MDCSPEITLSENSQSCQEQNPHDQSRSINTVWCFRGFLNGAPNASLARNNQQPKQNPKTQMSSKARMYVCS